MAMDGIDGLLPDGPKKKKAKKIQKKASKKKKKESWSWKEARKVVKEQAVKRRAKKRMAKLRAKLASKKSPKKARKIEKVIRHIKKKAMSDFDDLEAKIKAIMQDNRKLRKLWHSLDFNGNNIVSLAEIDKMLDLIKEEGDADDEKLSWCNSERTASDSAIRGLNFDLNGLNTAITNLKDDINSPVDGLKKQIRDTNTNIKTNHDNMVDETKTRKEENVAYQKDIATLVQAQNLLERAIKVLKDYYEDSLNKANTATTAAPMVAPTETHAATGHSEFTSNTPATWSGDSATGYAGQSTDVPDGHPRGEGLAALRDLRLALHLVQK